MLTIQRAKDADRLSHAYLLSGPAGIGKRAFGRALVQGLDDNDFTIHADSLTWPERPDFYHVTPLPDKATVSVDQVRQLSEIMAKTSHGGGRKIAVIEPLEGLTLNAANALLKTLEEPPGQSCLILIADALARVPATVLSRCVHVKLRAPSRTVASDWLREAVADGNQELALWLTRGAPLAALGALRDGRTDAAERCLDDMQSLLAGHTDPVTLASKWKDMGFRQIAGLLYSLAAELILEHRGLARPAAHFWPIAENVVTSVDLHNLFCYQDRLMSIKAQPAGSFNEQLVLENLLLAWPQRFRRSTVEAPLVPKYAGSQG